MLVIALKQVNKVFHDQATPTPVLFDINIEVSKGDFVAISGPSGSGKSTLMNILGLLDTPTSGHYLLDGKEVGNLPDRKLAKFRRQKIGFVFQNFNLIPRLTLLQNIELPMIYAGLSAKERHARAARLLKQVGLDAFADYKPTQVSGGQAQRVAIARALANKPSLLLADEPTGNLDSKNSRAIMEQLKVLNKAGVTIIVVTHNPEVAAFTHRTITVRDGRIQPRRTV